MAQKLGSYLVDRRYITPRALEEALTAQVIFGGRLGTILVEFGSISEEKLLAGLSDRFRVPPVDLKSLDSIPRGVIELIPMELAVKVLAIPLKVEGRRLNVAMLNPLDLQAINELSFFTSKSIHPLVIPEIRFIHCMQKYYGVAKEKRFLEISLRAKEEKERLETPPVQPAPTSLVEGFDTPFEIVDFTTLPGDPVLYGTEETASPSKPAPEPEASVLIDRDFFIHNLATVQSRNDVAELLMAYLGGQFPAAALFTLKGSTALGWQGVSGGKTAPRISGLEIPLAKPSVLHTVFQTQSSYLGPIPANEGNSRIFKALGQWPHFVLALPLKLQGRMIGQLLACGDLSDLQPRVLELEKLAAKSVMALEILILRNKILHL